ncbi:MAG: TonB-dependent receptor [Sediminibacterium sp.]
MYSFFKEKKRLSITFFAFLFSLTSFAQLTTLSGTVNDTTEKKPLAMASVNILRAKDSVLVKTVRTSSKGTFAVSNIPAGNYIIMVSYPQYADFTDKLMLSSEPSTLTIALDTKAHLLKEVIVKNTVSAIRVKGDTTEYKADSFYVTPNADVQELLKKMPGIQVNAKGEITAQGEKVNKVLVDGEEFFSDDPAVVTKNLRADVVDKVQVFDKKSDQAVFTGIDDGQKSKTINLQLKEDKKNGYFGKAEVGSNFNQFGNGKLMTNAFKGKRKIAGYVTTDNTKFDNLNWDEAQNYGDGSGMVTEFGDGGMSMIMTTSGDGDEGGSTGFPNQQSAGATFSNKFEKGSVNTSAQYNRLLVNGITGSYSKTILPTNSIVNNTQSTQRSEKKKYKLNTTDQWGTDSTGLFKLTLKAASVVSENTNSFSGGSYIPETGAQLNGTARTTSNNTTDKTLSGSLSYRLRFAKKGRTISVNSDFNFGDKAQNGFLNANNDYFGASNVVVKRETIAQNKELAQVTSATSINGVYTEPLGKNSFLILNYKIGIAGNNSERNTFDAKAGQQQIKVDSLSNHFKFNTVNNSGNISYRYAVKKVNFNIGTGIGAASYSLFDYATNASRTVRFTNFIPSATFNFTPKQQKKFVLSYLGTTQNPTLLQIQPIIDNTDPLNITVGNANLRQSFTNRFSFNFNSFKVMKSKYIQFSGSFSNTNDAIATASTIDVFGKSINQYINVDGNYNYGAGFYYDFELYKGINFGVNTGINGGRYNNIVNGIKNANDNTSTRLGMQLSYWGDKKVNFWSSFTASNNKTVSSIRPGASTNYWSYNNNSNFQFKFKKAKFYIDLSTDITVYQKSAAFPSQRNIYLVHPSLRKVISKNDKWEAKLMVYDVFNQNQFVDRNISSNFISETTNNGIRRYALFSIIYNFSKNGKPMSMGF